MTKAKNPGKLTGKAVTAAQNTPVPAGGIDTGDFPDALSYINSLAQTREGVEWDCRVYKVESAGRGVSEKQPYLFTIPLEDLPTIEQSLAEQFPGGGTFRVHVRGNNELVRNIKLEIGARPGWRPPLPAYLQSVQVAPVEHPREDRLEMFFTRMIEVQERSAQQTRDLIAALNAKPVTPPPTLTEQLAMFKQMQEMLPRGAQENTFEVFQKGMDFAQKIMDARGGDSGGATWLDILKEAMSSPEFKGVIGAIAAGAQNAHAQQQQLAPPALLSPDNPIAVAAMDTLLKQAAAGVDPAFLATKLFDQLPPDFIAELEAQGGNNNVIAYIMRQFPAAAMHKPWFARLVAEMWEDDQTAPPSPTLNNPDARPDSPQQPPA